MTGLAATAEENPVSDDVLQQDMEEYQAKGDSIVNAILECVLRNFDDEAQRNEIGDYIICKLIFEATGDNDAANKVVRYLRTGKWD